MIIYNASSNLWTWKLNGVYYLIHYLKNGFVRKLNYIVKFLTSMTVNFNHHQRLSVLVAFSYFSIFFFFFFLILEFNTMCLFGLALFSEISWYLQKKNRQERLPQTHECSKINFSTPSHPFLLSFIFQLLLRATLGRKINVKRADGIRCSSKVF